MKTTKQGFFVTTDGKNVMFTYILVSSLFLLWGREDVVTPPRVAEEFCALLPDARLHWIERCGHAPMIERPEEFTAGLSAFIEEVWEPEARIEPSAPKVAV